MRGTFYFILYLAAAGCSALPEELVPIGDCTKDADCKPKDMPSEMPGGMICKANQCVPCSAHADCSSQVCDVYGDVVGAGLCVPESSVIYVNNEAARCDQETKPEGTICDLEVAFQLLSMSPGKVIRVLGSGTAYRFPPVDRARGIIKIFGPAEPGAGKAASLIGDEPDNRIVLGPSAEVVLDGFSINPEAIVGTSCKVTIRRSVFTFVNMGASFEGCTVALDRNMITSMWGGFTFKGSTLQVVNNIIAGNEVGPSSNLLSFEGGSGTFQFNTVARNMIGESALLLSCVSSSLEIKNSIFAQNGSARLPTSGCQLVANSLVVGKSDMSSGQIQQEPEFEDTEMLDLRLKKGTENQLFLIDKAVGVNPMAEKFVDHDHFGNQRPRGSGYDIGAFEAAP